MPNKELVKKRFLRSLYTYEKEARVQKKMAERLLLRLKSFDTQGKVLEIGAGTGLFTRMFLKKFSPEKYFVTDLVKECAPFFEGLSVFFVASDGESLCFRENTFSLIVSNATFQWFLNPKKAFEAIGKLLLPGGILAFSTFGPKTMQEFSHRQTPPGLLTMRQILGLKPPFFEPLWEEAWVETIYFATPKEALRHVRETGAMGHLESKWSLKEIKTWEMKYQALRTSEGLPLTFEPIIMIWRKK
ncbi:methyltransferase domain-containing protein [Thermodesulfatator atlanticus]